MINSVVCTLMQSREDWLAILENDYKIKVVRDGDLVSLKYDQLESPMHEPIVQECRGMVVDTKRRKILAWPYNKFWNHGEALAAPIDWATAQVQEKLDGSLMILYWDDEHGWSVASSGTPRAGGNFGSDSSRTFREAFWTMFVDLRMALPDHEDRSTCFMFELCGAENRIIVKHEHPRLVLHGAREVVTGREADQHQLEMFGGRYCWEVVSTYPITSIADCLAAAAALDPLATEGFIVVDSRFNRVKIKSPRYVALHHMKGEATPRRAIELWQTGETEELLTHFPEMGSTITPVQNKLERAAERAAHDYRVHAQAPTRKDFAIAVKDAPWSAVTFKLYAQGGGAAAEAKKIMRAMTLTSLERIVDGL